MKPWRLISPWWPTNSSSAASEADTLAATDPSSDTAQRRLAEGEGKDERSGRSWAEWARTLWVALSWAWWGVTGALNLVNALLVLAMFSANLWVRANVILFLRSFLLHEDSVGCRRCARALCRR